MIAGRLSFDLTTNQTTRTLRELRRGGATIADLTESNPTRAGIHYRADLLAPLASPDALRYEPEPLGLPRAREAVAAEFRRRGITTPIDRLALTASTSEAYALLFKAICDAGDGVLIPQPSYPLFEHLTVLESVVAQSYRLVYHGRWRIDLDDLRARIDNRTRAIVVVSPNNPTGSFLHRDDLDALAVICAEHRLVLVGDEVFADYPLDAAPHAAPVSAATGIVTCSLGGLSKSIGLPQLKLGWIGFGGPAPLVDELLTAYEIVADAYLSVGTPVQVALPSLLERGAAIRADIQARVTANLSTLRRIVGAESAITVLPVEGGWSAVLQVPAYRSEEQLVLDLLTLDHVLLHPGFFFDFEREAYVVVSLLVEPSVFAHGVTQVVARATTPGRHS